MCRMERSRRTIASRGSSALAWKSTKRMTVSLRLLRSWSFFRSWARAASVFRPSLRLWSCSSAISKQLVKQPLSIKSSTGTELPRWSLSRCKCDLSKSVELSRTSIPRWCSRFAKPFRTENLLKACRLIIKRSPSQRKLDHPPRYREAPSGLEVLLHPCPLHQRSELFKN